MTRISFTPTCERGGVGSSRKPAVLACFSQNGNDSMIANGIAVSLARNVRGSARVGLVTKIHAVSDGSDFGRDFQQPINVPWAVRNRL